MLVAADWKQVSDVFGLSRRELDLAQALVTDATRLQISTLLGAARGR